MNLRNMLKSFRHKHEMNQKEFAEYLGLSYTTYNTYENQTRQPGLFVALQISEKLSCNVNDIFYMEQT